MINKINKLPQSEFIKLFANIFENARWIAKELYKQKPFGDFNELSSKMMNIFEMSSKEEKLKILNDHPDLGNKTKISSLTQDSLVDLQNLWRPAILITFTLVITGLAIGLWTSRLLHIDVITTILGAAPGGISGMSLVGSEYGVGAAVATLHAVRLITVLLILPLVVKCLTFFGVIKS